MKTLRAKIALLLVISIVSVVSLITITMASILGTQTDTASELLSRQAISLYAMAKRGGTAGILSDRPAPGEVDAGQTELLRSTTARLGTPLDLSVTRDLDDGRLRTASIRVGPQGWLMLDYDPPSAPEWWGWLLLITVSVGSIAVFVANRMSEPLALLERTVEAVDPNGALPVLPEEGPTEVRATAAAINSLSARLKRAMESRMRLVAAAGHDFRTPLTRMRLRAEFVADDEERALWLRDIDELKQIADSAIELVREETAQDAPEVIRAGDLVGSIVSELRELGFAVELTGADSVCVRANRLALSRALRNLFINAATHGVRGAVSVSGGATARITISDQGPGIDPAMLDQIFEPFFRAERARHQTFPGAGLGLSISREIIMREGGNIDIVNGAAGGLIQVVELPAVSGRADPFPPKVTPAVRF
ncbi:two-component sensor histidine kinase [Pleomorphomonas diazotrophica]|uniref:histidine kinase n=1 Tax=Pleomorphomonas diazotrophica TaxID=1166257 RepID=A0A1I4WJX2_9HYPH|nr:ATP-binding protein [Pleomorphomonas diazotrophica]PKR89073.1 two-component sensor histidine kinase [Pleomorphomonas diazotrophica]SFN13510.1 Signal transduction histidine kinase [Pleomorphomonas diazotrophica]